MGKFLDSVDVKALRFAIGFPVLLAAAFALSAVLLRPDLPDPLAVQWNDGGGINFAPFAAYVGVGAAMIIAAGWLVLLQAVPVSRPTVMRRIMMGAGLTLSLFVTTVLAAGLVGQAGEADARESHVNFIVLSTGSGAALALGVIMGFVFKADQQWTPEDDRALQQALELELDPELATDSIRLWVHARSSVFVMIGIASLFPASLIAIAVPWLGALLVAAAILGAAFLFARVTADRSGVVDVPAEAISAAAPADVRAADYGGWGYRNHGGTAAVLVSSGPAVVVRKTDGHRLAVSGGNTDSAVRLAEVLTRIAARARKDGRSPSEGEGDA